MNARQKAKRFKRLYEGLLKQPKPMQDQNTGHWVRKTKINSVYDLAGVKTWGVEYQCDKCGFIITVIEDSGCYKYCPRCGQRCIELQERKE